ncbi:MAG: hypothetical protein M3Z32_09265 [Acidobacteriota bacterium]|nr:hypothetical protein [Acidobacteriota bacterium]
MRKLLLVAGFGSLLPLCAMAESWTGVISDSRCGAKHEALSASDVKCMQACIKRGATPVLLTGGKMYAISSSSDEQVAPHVGQKVIVTGKLEKDRGGDFITIESITKAE